jgi:hypothetical protein
MHFIHLDDELKVQWRDTIEIKNTFYVKGYDFNGTTNFILLQDKSSNRDLKIISVNPYANQVSEFEPRRLTEIDVTNFDIIQNSAVIAGYIDKRPAAFVYDMNNNNLKTLTNVYQNKSDLLEVKINNDSLTFNVLATIQDNKKDRTVLVNTYDYEGNPVRDYELITKENHQLVTAISSSISNIEQVVTGLYSYKLGTSPSGIYVNHVDRSGQQTMRYLPFGQFNSFFEHEGKKRAQKLREKSLDGHRRDKAFRYRTEATFRKMVEKEEGLIVMAEFFKPWSLSEHNGSMQRFMNSTNPSLYGRGYDYENLQDDVKELEFTHAFVYALDKSGNLKWDHNYAIDETVEGVLASYGAFLYHNEQAYFAHYYDEDLVVEFLNREDQDAPPQSIKLPLLEETDELKFEADDFGGVVHWNRDKYIVYGIHHIRPEDKSLPLRKVFFINGIKIGPKMVAKKLEE